MQTIRNLCQKNFFHYGFTDRGNMLHNYKLQQTSVVPRWEIEIFLTKEVTARNLLS